jgi:hypothetical protein
MSCRSSSLSSRPAVPFPARSTTTMIDSEAERLSSGDEIASDTDVEQYISSEDWSLKEYHLGEKYFDFTIAKQLLELPDLGNNWPELNVSESFVTDHCIY